MKTVKFVTKNEAWNVLESLSNVHMFVFLVYSVLARVTKKCRITKEVHEYPELKKTVMIQTSFNSDYKKRIDNQLIRENKELDEYKQGKNNMPIDFVSNNKVAGYFNDKKVVCHYPLKNSNAKIIQFTHKGIEITKQALKSLDIFPKKYAPTNQGIEEKEVKINKMYFDNLISFTVNNVRYVIV